MIMLAFADRQPFKTTCTTVLPSAGTAQNSKSISHDKALPDAGK